MRKLLVATMTVVLLGALAGPSMAGKGGEPGNGANATQTPSIDLCSVDGIAVNGCASGTVTAAAAPQPHLGGTVGFSVGYPKLPRNRTPRVQLLCYQHQVLVYGEAYKFDQTFLLGGGGSEWLATGGAATCQADLYYWDYKGATQTFVWLASMTFEAAGAAV